MFAPPPALHVRIRANLIQKSRSKTTRVLHDSPKLLSSSQLAVFTVHSRRASREDGSAMSMRKMPSLHFTCEATENGLTATIRGQHVAPVWVLVCGRIANDEQSGEPNGTSNRSAN
jgi:hypothetical protein